METKTFRNTTYTVTDSRRGWKNDRTIHSLTGPEGAGYVLVEFDNTLRILTALATGRSHRWHDQTVEIMAEMQAEAEEITPEPSDSTTLRSALAYWNRETEKWMAKRSALPAGSSRAKVTTANARWMSACEVRDRVAQRLYDLTGEVE